MIDEPLDTTMNRLRDAVRRREQGLPPVDDDGELLERALQAIDRLTDRSPGYPTFTDCDCDCHDDDD